MKEIKMKELIEDAVELRKEMFEKAGELSSYSEVGWMIFG